ncbi:MAG: phage major capsid protein [Collinsella sp.]|nr:phage major capsid protein [Collinsella sp.]
MAALITSNFTMPQEYAAGVFKKAQSTSALAQLSGAMPQKFGKTNVMVLTSAPKAEIVAEGGEKSPTPTAYANKTISPIKLQVTARVSNEVMWADEDYQMGVLSDVGENCGIALGRALDIVGIHKANPLTGAAASSVAEGLTDATDAAQLSGTKYDAAIEAASGLVIANGYTPTGIALDPALSFGLATMRDTTGRRIYPELGYGQNAAAFEGMTAAVSDTVSGKELSKASNIIGIVGQFDAFRWGVQREIAMHTIEFGDPDGLGDLQRLNQVAIRAEIVYGIGILDLKAFAKVTKAAA